MVHIFLIFGCLFCYDHVLSLNLNFVFFYDAISRKGYIIQKLICFKQELRRDTVAVIDYYALFRKNGLNNSAFFVKIVTTCFNRTQAEYSEFFLIIQKHF